MRQQAVTLPVPAGPALPIQTPARPLTRQITVPTLTFSAKAWLKLQYLCHLGETEIGGMGLARGTDPLYIDDFILIKQTSNAVHVSFDTEDLDDHFLAQRDAGLEFERYASLWCHTHPGGSAMPSHTDEDTFAEVFGHGCRSYAVMFILARGGETYARLQFSAGPGGCLVIPVKVDWASWVKDVVEDRTVWEAEYRAKLTIEQFGQYQYAYWPERTTDAAVDRIYENHEPKVCWLCGGDEQLTEDGLCRYCAVVATM